MHPSHVEQLVRDRRTDLATSRGRQVRHGRTSRGLVRLTRRGLEMTGHGLIRLGVRLAGAGPQPNGSRPAGVGALDTSC